MRVREVASEFVLGIADVAHRARAIHEALHAGLLPAPPMVSRMAIVAPDAQLAPGSMVGHFAVIGPAARLKEHALVMHSVVVGHDTFVGANSVLCAGVCVGGHVQIGARTFVGANAMLAPKMNLAEGTYIAAGAACFRDTDPDSRWIGNPARRNGTTKGKQPDRQ